MKKILFISIILSLLAANNLLHAQQWHSYNPTAWFDVNDVEIPGPGIIAIGGGQESNNATQIMFQTTNYGLTWTENAHDGLAPWNKSIAFSDSVNGYGVGYDGRIIKTDDAGLNWGYPVYPFNRNLNKIVYAGNGTYFVAGGNKTNDSIQTILKSNNSGNSWNVIYDTLGPWLKSIFFFDTLKGYAVGDKGLILSTTNGGNMWTPITAPVQRDFNAITFINADTGYIVGGTPSGLCRRTILRTVNGGSSWSVLIDTSGGILKDISFAGAMEGYTVGDSATVLKTMDGGLNWLPIVIDTSLTGNESFNAVKFYDRNFGVIGGKAGVLYVYQNGPVELYNFGISQIGNTDATLQGGINTHSSNMKYSFVYSNNITFLSSLCTPEVNVQNDSLMIISKHIGGLSPNTTYYYFLKATSAQDTVYSDTLSFYTGVNPACSFQTLDATDVSTGGAIMNGFINKFPEPVNLFFEYGTSPAFGSQIAATPVSVNDTLMHNIQIFITPVLVYEHYFFRLKGVTATRTYYGDTKMFHAVNQPYVRTEEATNITANSVQLNATANAGSFPCALKFEYGLTFLYGTEINAIPDSLTGTNNVNASCVISGLSPSTTYHFRIKAISSLGTSYGRDRTFRICRATAVTLPAEIVNPNSVQVRGTVDNNNIPAAIKFEYGTTLGYGNEVTAIPDSAIVTGIVNAFRILTGLSAGITYHYRIKAVNSVGTSYGEDKTFNTGIPSVITCQASNIEMSSAQLNGIVGASNFPTGIKFVYGLTNQYGSEMDAIPDSVSGSNPFNVSCTLTGLTPYTTYHYCVKASNSNGTVNGSDVFFTTGAPMASTLSATNITVSSAQLNGIVNANYMPTANIFKYGISPNFGNEVPAVPDSVTGHIDVNISYQLHGLLPNTTYYFRVKAISSIGTAYGNNMLFNTAQPLITLPADNISPNSARLNGSVDAVGIPTAVSFEYGTTTAYGNVINAVPDSAYNIGSIDVYALPAGLVPNTTYHFRIKGSNTLTTEFGEDMMFYTGYPEIPNFDFETWTPITFAKPQGWNVAMGRISRYTPACNGDYAVKIENDTIVNGQPGVILIGESSDGQNVIGGIPFNARPDTLIGCFNYSLPANDTALVGLFLKKQGVFISSNWYKIYGNSSGNFTELKFPIPYTVPGNADSLIIGLTATDTRHMSHLRTGGYLIVDYIRFTGATESIPNNDFENWDFNTIFTPDNWWYNNKYTPDPSHPQNPAVSRTEDAQHGNYAALVRNYLYPSYIIPYAMPGFLSTNYYWNGPGFSVNCRHQTLTGYYKFLPENNDTMSVSIMMFKNHTKIGGGRFQSNSVVTDYTPFVIQIIYIDNDTVVPDSGTISVQSCSRRTLGNSRLYIDNLNFDGFLSGVKEPPLTNVENFDFNVYPNPLSDQATVSFTMNQDRFVKVRLFDLSGKQVALLAECMYKAGNHKLDLSAQGLQKGFYICVINTGNRIFSRKLIIY